MYCISALRRMSGVVTVAVALGLCGGILAGEQVVLGPSVAEAQTMDVQVESTVKGTVGFGMIGAELGFFIPALVGLHDLWAFIVFPIVGAAGGAVGGYFLFDEPQRVEGSVAMLAIGMALIVPTLVATLALTAYDPSDEGIEVESDDEPPPSEEEAIENEGFEDPAPEEEAAEARRRIREAASGASAGLFRVNERGLHLGVPGLAIGQAYSAEEIARYGAAQTTELHLPLFSGSF